MNADEREKNEELIYVASPFWDELETVRQDRLEKVCAVTAEMLRRGRLVFSPIAHSVLIAKYGGLGGMWKDWERFDKAMLERCDRMAILELPGWSASVGVRAEIELFEKMGKPIEFLTMDSDLVVAALERMKERTANGR